MGNVGSKLGATHCIDHYEGQDLYDTKMGVLHSWRNEPELSNETVNQFFFSFTTKLSYGPLVIQ